MAAGCGANATTTPPLSPAATTDSVPSSAIPVSPAKSAALGAYNGMWADEQAAAVTADYQSPLLAEHATGAALSVLVRGLYSLRLQHLVIKGQLATHPEVTSLTPPAHPTAAAVVDCFNDSHWLAYKDAGGLQDNVPGGRRHVTATVTDVSGVWKVTELNTGAEGTC